VKTEKTFYSEATNIASGRKPLVIYTVSTISLVIQLIVLGLLISGYLVKRQKKYRQHGMIMLSALLLHILTVLLVMIPSFGVFFSDVSMLNFADTLVIATLIHVSAGLSAVLLGIWIVGSWHLQASVATCIRKKRFMDLTLSLWFLAIFLGIILYWAIIQTI
jgi:uncharacterized membrane protein YozB (DUF420 family)